LVSGGICLSDCRVCAITIAPPRLFQMRLPATSFRGHKEQAMRFLPRSILLLLIGLLLGHGAGFFHRPPALRAAEPVVELEPEIPPGFHVVFRLPDDFAPMTVVCDGELEAGRAEKLARNAHDAYNFICQTEQWSSRELIKAPVQVRVVKEMKNGSLGFAGKNVFTIGVEYIDNPLAQGTLAHELTHCQDRRQSNNHRQPHYLAEGRALLNGRAYREKVGQKPGGYDRGMRNMILKFTPLDAQEILSEVPGKSELIGPVTARVEFLGCFFLDFLRVKYSLPDIHPRTARLVMDLAQGMAYEEAFQKEIGMSLEEAKGQFISFLQQTTGPARLQGTIWQDL
jgi:hypothetical protein